MLKTRLIPASLLALAVQITVPALALAADGVPEPRDIAYPGVISLSVEATDVERRVFTVHESVPVTAGALTLLFPEWIPGRHGPTGVVARIAGLHVTAGGASLNWTRDPLNPFAFRVNVPSGVTRIDLDFEYLKTGEGDRERSFVTSQLLRVQWHELLLYPAGYFVRGIPVRASLELPPSWDWAGALPLERRSGAHLEFKPVSLETLIDSPILAGRNVEHIDLDPGAREPVMLDLAAERPDQIALSAAALEAHRALVRQAYRLFRSRHYDQYHFLVTVSDTAATIGLEHHQSSEDSVGSEHFTEWAESWAGRDLLPHEFAHSWNGKFRRPFELTTPDYNVPMQDGLLWMYEGQTDYWGLVLSARSGLISALQARELLADVAANDEGARGRTWRSLQDTTNEPLLRAGRPVWPSWQRGRDYYSEMQLVWLDVDTKIRELSKGTRSLDDFARLFFAGTDGGEVVRTYDADDISAALAQVQDYDWTRFLRARLERRDDAPLDGLQRGGWRLIYTEEPNSASKAREAYLGSTSFRDSIGLDVGRDGVIGNVRWDGPAYRAHIAPGMKLIAVNGRTFKAPLLRDVIKAARTSVAPIELLVLDNDVYRSERLEYHDGLRYPHLERYDGNPDLLDAILAPLS